MKTKVHPPTLVFAYLSISLAPAADVVATWNNTTGNWNDAAQWSSNPAFPNNGAQTFDAIQTGGTLTLNQNITIEKYTLSGGSNTSAGSILTLNDDLLWSAGAFTGTGTIQANGGAIFSASGVKDISAGRVLNLGGDSSWTAGNIRIGTGGMINNTTGQTFTTNSDGTLTNPFGGTGTFNNSGTFTKSGGAGTTLVNGVLLFNNSGTVNVNSGTLNLAGSGGSNSTGVFNVGSGATLQFSNDHTLGAASSITGVGSVVISSGTVNVNGSYTGGGNLLISSGTVNFANAASTSSLTQTGGTLGGGGNFTISGTTTFSSGSMTGTGITQANSGVTFDTTGAKDISGGRVLNLAGNSSWTAGTIRIGTGGVINNNTGQTLTTNSDGTLTNPFGGTGTFNNSGTFTKSGGAGTTTVSGVLLFNNSGAVNVNSGTLNFTSSVAQHTGTTLTGGTWNVRNGSTLSFSQGSDIQNNQGNVTLDGIGSTFNRLTAALNNNQNKITLRNGRNLTTAGALTNSGTVAVENATTSLTIGTAGANAYTQTGGVTQLIDGGSIQASSFNLNGGSIIGNGNIISNITVGNTTTSIIAPGSSAGQINITGSLTLSNMSILNLEIGGYTSGSQHDFISLSALFAAGGVLNISVIDMFNSSIQIGDSFTLATAGSSITNSFSNVASGGTYTDLATGREFTVFYGLGSSFGANNLVAVAGIPESSTILLSALAVLPLLRRRKVLE